MLDKPEYPCDKCDMKMSCSMMCRDWAFWFFYHWRVSTAKLRHKEPNLDESEANEFALNMARDIAEARKSRRASNKKK